MIVTLKVKLGACWNTDIEFTDLSTLEEVHHAIQEAVEFDNDHLYEFFTARTERARERVTFDAENGRIFTTRIRDLLPLPPKTKLFYLFDYGDNWTFRLIPSRKKPFPPDQGVNYPRIVNEAGEKPIQYELYDEDF